MLKLRFERYITVLNGHKSAHGIHRRDVTHTLSKVSCFFYLNPFIFVGYGNDRFLFHINPYTVFRMLCNNVDGRLCLYFELGLPVVT